MKIIIVLAFLILGSNSFAQSLPDNIASLYHKLSELPYEEKLDLINKEIKKNNKEPWLYWLKAGIYEMMGEDVKTINNYKQAIAIDPNFSGGHASYARYLTNDSTQWETALIHINKAIEIEPEGFHYHVDRGEIYLLLKKYDLALKDANIEIALPDSDPAPGLILKFKTLYASDAKKELNTFLKENDLSDVTMLMSTDDVIVLATIYDELGEKAKACKCYNSLLENYQMSDLAVPEEIAKRLKKCK
jgi:tetratricopeptide (TPR) repeat protein